MELHTCKPVCCSPEILDFSLGSTDSYFPGGGIVFDSDPYDEYIETINKLRASMTTLKKAEQRYTKAQAKEKPEATSSSKEEILADRSKGSAHIDLAAG